MLSAAETGRVKAFSDLEGQDFTDEELRKPSREEIEACKARTLAALAGVLDTLNARNLVGAVKTNSGTDPVYVRYTAAESAPGFTEASTQRVVRIQERKIDPLAPPAFKLKKQYGNGGPPSPPTTILRAPTRKLTAEDQANWKIPPAISNWVNSKGLIIPLATRVALDGRGLEEHTISDKFAKLSETLYLTERAANEEMRARERIMRQLEQKKRDDEERRLQEMAFAARAGAAAAATREVDDGAGDAYSTFGAGAGAGSGGISIAGAASDAFASEEELAAAAARDAQREQRRRELEREMRQGGQGASQAATGTGAAPRVRDVSEQIALGGAAPKPSGGVRFDERLFSRDAGRGSAAGMAGDEAYNLYDQPLFADRSTVGLHRPRKGLGYEGPAEGAGAAPAGPVQFEKAAADAVNTTAGGAVPVPDAVAARAKRRNEDEEEEEEEGDDASHRDKRSRYADGDKSNKRGSDDD